MKHGQVKKSRYFLKSDDRGASLIAVVVALVFVATIGVITMEVTTMNTRLSEIDVSGTENFYNAEKVMDGVKRAMAVEASSLMQEVYTSSVFTGSHTGDEDFDFQEALRREYMDRLENYFKDSSSAIERKKETADGLPLYNEGKYDESQVKNALQTINEEGLKEIMGEAVWEDILEEVLKEIYKGKYSADAWLNQWETAWRKSGHKVWDENWWTNWESAAWMATWKTTWNSNWGVTWDATWAEMQKRFQGYLKLDNPNKLVFTTDYERGLFTLKNLSVNFVDSEGYETTITTDLVFHTPTFQFDDGTSQSFMDYTLIAKDKVTVDAPNINVKGNVYAGDGGIESSSSKSAAFTGDNIVTSGDIVVNGTSELTFGEAGGTTHIWAKNIITEGDSGAKPTLTMNGEINVENDLKINGYGSEVTLTGYYNGYNFREDYVRNGESVELANPAQDASSSSAIMINGEKCKLDIRELDHLFLAGRTFITRGSNADDIKLGESLSVRTDQLACYVSARYVEKTEEGYVNFTADGMDEYIESLGVTDMEPGEYRIIFEGYLKTNGQVAPYYYNGDNNVVYYLNFVSEEAANAFFRDYWKYRVGKRLYDYRYADSYSYNVEIDLDESKLFTLGGNLLYPYVDGDGVEQRGALPGAGSEYGSTKWNSDSIYWQRADLLARTYKSLRDDLSGDPAKAKSEEVREETDLFANLFDEDMLESLLRSGRNDNGVMAMNSTTPYSIDSSCTADIVVARGDVTVDREFEGIIIAKGNVKLNYKTTGMVVSGGTISDDGTISGGTISLGSSNLEVEQNVGRVDELLTGHPEIAQIFKGCQQSDGTRIADYLTYENWTKNEG